MSEGDLIEDLISYYVDQNTDLIPADQEKTVTPDSQGKHNVHGTQDLTPGTAHTTDMYMDSGVDSAYMIALSPGSDHDPPQVASVIEEIISRAGSGDCSLTKSGLDKQKRVGKKETSFSCSYCGRCYKRKYPLTLHKKIHTGEKPCLCTICGKCFRTKLGLDRHKSVHTNERPFTCCDCGKCFSGKRNLTKHKRSHTGEKPFACSVCGKRFATNTEVSEHGKRHSGKKPFSCSKSNQENIDQTIKDNTGKPK
uniref:C2H2-type domain-containing protein n=1 Tax=Leptobrachium leishanense TaxID=445787 RepID=A0A8C5PUY4_9ANUR